MIAATVRIRTALIYPSHSGRSTEKDRVEALVASIKEIGLKTPITVRRTKRFADGRPIDAYEIVTGLHRYAAACRLGWQEIDCVVTDDDDLHVELWTIDENLIRAELSPSDRAVATARRKEIYEELHPETRATNDGGPGRAKTRRKVCDDTDDEPADRFTTNTAKATGQSERKVQLDAERGGKIAADVLATITGSQWDKGAVLDILKKLSHDEQRQALHRVQSGASPSFQDALAFIRGDQERTNKARTKGAGRRRVAAAAVLQRPAHVTQLYCIVRTMHFVINEFKDAAEAACLTVRWDAPINDDDLAEVVDFLSSLLAQRRAGP
jgi:hypothetical protein